MGRTPTPRLHTNVDFAAHGLRLLARQQQAHGWFHLRDPHPVALSPVCVHWYGKLCIKLVGQAKRALRLAPVSALRCAADTGAGQRSRLGRELERADDRNERRRARAHRRKHVCIAMRTCSTASRHQLTAAEDVAVLSPLASVRCVSTGCSQRQRHTCVCALACESSRRNGRARGGTRGSRKRSASPTVPRSVSTHIHTHTCSSCTPSSVAFSTSTLPNREAPHPSCARGVDRVGMRVRGQECVGWGRGSNSECV